MNIILGTMYKKVGLYRITDTIKYLNVLLSYIRYYGGGEIEMKTREFKITSDGKEVATIECTDDGFNVKCTEECAKMCKDFKGCC